MNITPDYLVERKRHKTQLVQWKIIVLLLVAILVAIVGRQYTSLLSANTSNYIAKVRISNLILEDSTRENILIRLGEDAKVKAIVLSINSPGGASTASERLYNILKDISSKKPVVVVMEDLATSGGYLIALASNHIIAHNSTITGSIGVIAQGAEITNLAEKLGITLYNFKSGEFKATPNPMEKLTPEVQEVILVTIKDIYNYFVELVAEERGLPKEEVLRIADGRIYTGRQAQALKLIDAIGTVEDATKWLHEVKQLDKNLPVVEVPLKVKSWMEVVFGDTLEHKFDNMMHNTFKVLMHHGS